MDARPVDTRFHMAMAWARAGNLPRAVAGFRQVVASDPAHVPALLQLGHALLKLGQVQDAVDCYARVLAVAPDDTEARIRYNFLKTEMSRAAMLAAKPRAFLANHPDGKLNLNYAKPFRSHRSGWGYALRALEPLHNEQGTLFDGCLEENFARRYWQDGVREARVLDELRKCGLFQHLATSEEQGLVPYSRPWVGVIHNPPNMPEWFHYHESPQSILGRDIWRKSLEHCRGLFTFSEYAGAWLRRATGLPVSVLAFPTEVPERRFDFQRFLANRHKKIVQVGWWLRQVAAIYRLPLARNNPLGYEKVRLVPQFFDDADEFLKGLIAREAEMHPGETEPRFAENTRTQPHLDNDGYDELLAENIAFAFLHDANANNLVVECIARATPLLINPLPAIVEYLGEAYPLFATDVDIAGAKALDLDLIRQAHEYLEALEIRRKLTAEYFLEDVRASLVYRSLSFY
jgi:tetratricopeptide (TPR) repeat protein